MLNKASSRQKGEIMKKMCDKMCCRIAFIIVLLIFAVGAQDAPAQANKLIGKPQRADAASVKAKLIKSDASKTDGAESPKTVATAAKVQSRIVLQINQRRDQPPLVTTAVGQVTRVELPEPVLQYKTYSDGLHIGESVAGQKFNYIYIVPTAAGIRRNFVIEIASGSVELDLQSIAWDEKRATPFTREVAVVKAQETDKFADLQIENNNLKKELTAKATEIAGFDDQFAAAAQVARGAELKAASKLLFVGGKTRRLRTVTSESKVFQITLTFEERDGNGRLWRVFEIENRGKQKINLLEIKGDARTLGGWFVETSENINQSGVLAPKQKLKVAILEPDSESAKKTLLFVTAQEVVKF